MKLSKLLPQKYPLVGGLEHSPFFVFGSGRNGSTLLNRMLNQHSQIFLPSEQYFLGDSIIKYQLYNFLIWRDLVKVVVGELNPEAEKHTWGYDGKGLLKVFFSMKEKSLDRVIDWVFRDYAGKMDKHPIYWGDTTPPNIHFIPEIYSLFPKGKYVFLLRDGRDVVASHKMAGEAYVGKMTTIENASALWLKSIKAFEWLRRQTDVHLLRYEALVSDPLREIKALCDYLEIRYETAMLADEREVPDIDAYHEPIHQHIGKPIFQSSVGRYSELLSPAELLTVNKLLGKQLSKFGYL